MKLGTESTLPKELEAVYENFISTLDKFQRELQASPLPLFETTHANAPDLIELKAAAEKLSPFKRVVFLGTGGASLGAQVLVQLAGWGTVAGTPSGTQIDFLDNLSAYEMTAVLNPDTLSNTAFVAISKSGETAETLMQFSCALTAIENAGLNRVEHIICLTENKPNTLRQLAESLGLTVLAHNEKIGGRYSVFTNVGLLPAAIVGLNIENIRAGAATALNIFFTKTLSDNIVLSGAARQISHAKAGRQISVLMPYDSRLEKLGLWFRQLWAESLGKKGRGTTPINALGPVDQHSQLQLYLDGPDDKFYTLIKTKTMLGPQAISGIGEKQALAWLHKRYLDELVQAHCKATYRVLLDHGRPVRLISLGVLDEKSLGVLLMNLMLETICAAHLLAVDAFDQPAVEQSKIIAKKIMQQTKNKV